MIDTGSQAIMKEHFSKTFEDLRCNSGIRSIPIFPNIPIFKVSQVQVWETDQKVKGKLLILDYTKKVFLGGPD